MRTKKRICASGIARRFVRSRGFCHEPGHRRIRRIQDRRRSVQETRVGSRLQSLFTRGGRRTDAGEHQTGLAGRWYAARLAGWHFRIPWNHYRPDGRQLYPPNRSGCARICRSASSPRARAVCGAVGSSTAATGRIASAQKTETLSEAIVSPNAEREACRPSVRDALFELRGRSNAKSRKSRCRASKRELRRGKLRRLRR